MSTTNINSNQNKTFKYMKRIISDPRFARREGVFAIETDKLINEVLNNDNLEVVYFVKGDNYYHYNICDEEFELSKELFKELTNLTLEYHEILFVKYRDIQLINDNENVLVLDHIQDPGNVGTILRSANAFDFKNIILVNCANIFNVKTIRSAKGSMFDLNIEIFDHEQAANFLKIKNYNVLTTNVHGENVTNIDTKDKYALVLGNEGYGISEVINNVSTSNIKIETNNVESLNVSIAASILMYELSKEK